MRLSREEFREQLVDYVYGELASAQRESFEACLADSADFRRELAELRTTLESARGGLALLEEAPPAHMRQALVALASAPTSPPLRLPQKQPAPEHSPGALASVLAWLSKPASLGALSVAAVAALGLLVRESRHENDQPGRPEPTAPMLQPRPTGAIEPPTDAPGTAPAKPATTDDTWHNAAPREQADEQDHDLHHEPTRDADDERNPRESYPSPAKRTPPPQRPSASKGAAAPAAESRSRRGAASAVRSEAPPSDRLEQETSDSPSPAPSAAPARKPSPLNESDARDSAGITSQPQPAPQAIGTGARAPTPQQPATPEALEREATAHLAAHRLRDAAHVYETLLRRFPKDARVPQWQNQLKQTQRALRELTE